MRDNGVAYSGFAPFLFPLVSQLLQRYLHALSCDVYRASRKSRSLCLGDYRVFSLSCYDSSRAPVLVRLNISVHRLVLTEISFYI